MSTLQVASTSKGTRHSRARTRESSNVTGSEVEDEEDDDDELRESTTVPVRPETTKGRRGGKNEETLYSMDEEQAILKFYNIKSFDVNDWDLDPLEIGIELMAALQGGAADQNATSSPELAGLPTNVRTRGKNGRGAIGVNMVSVKNIDSSDPIGIKQSIFGKTRPQMIDMDIYQRILVSHKNFDPKVFLKAVHNTTSYRDITDIGCRNLQYSIDKRAEVMKDLVKQHFAKFVNAKSTIDSFYDEMKTNNLISSESQGLAPYVKSLDGLAAAAKNVYSPMIERKEKADKIRTALSLLDQWKFFFNLPSSLLESIKKENYDAAVRDYNKGKYLMTSSFSTVRADRPTQASATDSARESKMKLSTGILNDVAENVNQEQPSIPQQTPVAPVSSANTKSNNAAAANSLLPEAHRDVFQHVWKEVENITENFRKKLFNDLRNSNQPLDVQERVLKYLVDLNPEQDPVWFYLNNQHDTIIHKLLAVYEEHLEQMDDLKQSYYATLRAPSASIPLPKPHYLGSLPSSVDQLKDEGEEEPQGTQSVQRSRLKSTAHKNLFSTLDGALMIRRTERWTLVQFQRAVGSVHTKEFESAFLEEYDLQAWKSTLKVVKSLGKILTASMQDFWRLCKIFSEDRIQKTQSNVQTSTVPAHKGKRRADVKRMMHCQTMIRQIVELYSTLLGHCFHLQTPLAELKKPSPMRTGSTQGQTTNLENVLSPRATIAVTGPSVPVTSNSVDGLLVHESGSSLQLAKNVQTYKESMAMISTLPSVSAPLKWHGTFLAVSHPLMASHWAAKIMKELSQIYDEIKNHRVGGGTLIEERVLRCVGDVANNIKKRCVEVVCEGMTLESRKFNEYEEFLFDIDQRDSILSKARDSSPVRPSPAAKSNAANFAEEDLTQDSTQCIKLYYRFLKITLNALYKVAAAPVCSQLPPPTEQNSFHLLPANQTALLIFGVHDEPSGGLKNSAPIAYHYDTPPASSIVPQQILDQIVSFVSNSFCELLDGLEWLATRWVAPSGMSSTTDTTSSTTLWDESRLEEIMIPPHKKFHGEGIGGLVGAIASDESNTHSKKRAHIGKIIVDKKGKAIDTQIRPYCYEILMSLVMVHAEVSDASQNLVKHVISSLLHSLALDLLQSFRGVDRFSEMGAMQATLETEFIHQTLSIYETPQTMQVFSLIYGVIQENTAKVVAETSSPSKAVATTKEEGVELVKQYLLKAKQSTWMQFLCFRDDGDGVEFKSETQIEPKEEEKEAPVGPKYLLAAVQSEGDYSGNRLSGVDFARLSVVPPPKK
ncbi:hypothetical protein BCR33DRAFT_788418 [Rhizoclosmatium globosum]|uniref:Exocyst complex component EXOC2/Sec5 N-terminal domain-containing protein n=1 Tax=Rhizoclosmatium globosum TaxID=329046 RepID=A0A1Y2BXB2_9FUNG|nr:hypothetical protein BCR33DRAFT_788418 [Rhizoclosmatium globosum]|eukprot:ORY39412.1 hypothetical protein BCR33DRAFT_788418 [Rhizoclosmatium globosum]